MQFKSEDELIDFAYDSFLEQAADNLSPADQILFAMQFDDLGAVDIVSLSDNWSEYGVIGVNNDEYCELHIGLVDEKDDLTDIFGRVLVKKQINDKFIKIDWKQEDA